MIHYTSFEIKDVTIDCILNRYQDIFLVALTDGQNLLLDKTNRPHLRSSGVVTFNDRGTWQKCGNWTPYDDAAFASRLCHYLGFTDYLSFSVTSLDSRPIRVVPYTANFSAVINLTKQVHCKVLVVGCQNATDIDIGSSDSSIRNIPWDAEIYVDGAFKCHGALLNSRWIITSIGCFKGELRYFFRLSAQFNYICEY